VEALDEQTCVVEVGSDTPLLLAAYLGMIGADFEVAEPPELVDQLRVLADRYRRASASRRSEARSQETVREPST
jgi:hypothetical protein